MDSEDSEEELELMVLELLLLRKKNKARKRRIWVHEIYKKRFEFGIQHLVGQMEISNRESYFK